MSKTPKSEIRGIRNIMRNGNQFDEKYYLGTRKFNGKNSIETAGESTSVMGNKEQKSLSFTQNC